MGAEEEEGGGLPRAIAPQIIRSRLISWLQLRIAFSRDVRVALCEANKEAATNTVGGASQHKAQSSHTAAATTLRGGTTQFMCSTPL